MAIQIREQLKRWFSRGQYPTEEQFADAFDSFVHKGDKIGVGSMDQQTLDIINAKAEQTALTAEVAARQNAVRELVGRIDALGAEVLAYDESDFRAREIADGAYIRIYTCPAHFDGSTLIRAVMADNPDGGIVQDILELYTNGEMDTCHVTNMTSQHGYSLYTRYNSDDDTLEVYRWFSDDLPIKLYVWKEEGETGEWELTPLDEEDPDYEDIISELQPASSAIAQAIAGKQDTLTFDTVPTEGSENPVTSGGIFTLFSEGYNFLRQAISALQTKHATLVSSGTFTPQDNTIYSGTGITGFTIDDTDMDTTFVLSFDTASSGAVTVTVPAGYKFAETPVFGTSEHWEIAVRRGYVVWTKYALS
jgi:hypothetical protein